VLSVVEKINEPRYPSFKGIMAAKKKPFTTLTLADVGAEPALLGLAGAGTRVVEAQPRAAKSAGEISSDDGTGAARLAAFLTAHSFA
jgi:electron transfer flavoprotein beta subunit